MFSHFDKIPACDGQTDGHLATAYSALCTVSCGKTKSTEENWETTIVEHTAM